jgi:ubiquinone/menaquinone biosynthesis C-methylase UbiE
VSKRFVRLVFFLLGVTIGAFLGVRWITRRASLITPPAFAPLLGNPLRLAYRNPAQVLDFAGAQRGWSILDLGCGTGVFTIEAARRVGPSGVVHAVDVQPAMIDALRGRMRATNLTNIQTHVAPATHLPLDDHSVDCVLMISVLPMLHGKPSALREVKRVLKPNGVLVVGEELIEPEYVTASTTVRWVEEAGFRLIAREQNVLRYTLKFVKARDSESHAT